jgi:hypothetical protein
MACAISDSEDYTGTKPRGEAGAATAEEENEIRHEHADREAAG